MIVEYYDRILGHAENKSNETGIFLVNFVN